MQRHAAPVAVGTSMAHGRKGPAGVGYSMRQISDTCTRIIGRAYVGEVTSAGKLPANAKGNCLGLIFDVNPALLNDRVAVIASTFQKYVYQGVKFTYVPQCPTSTGGSVGLVFERDPLEISANTQSSQFLAEVMSYEHAVLTPAYVEAATAYTRDPKELKTWFLGAPDATLSTRETSQGNLLCYLSNAQAPSATFSGGYGFIVMDYVLDLIAPSLLPNKQNITAITAAPSQWVDGSAVATSAIVNNCPSVSVNGATMYPYWNAPKWQTQFSAFKAGVVGEVHLGGTNSVADASGNTFANFQSYVGQAYDSNGIQISIAAAAGSAGSSTLKYGQKMYFCVHRLVLPGTGVYGNVLTWHTTLSSARAAASLLQQTSTTGASTNVLPDFILGDSATASCAIGGWIRLIAEGSTSEDNA